MKLFLLRKRLPLLCAFLFLFSTGKSQNRLGALNIGDKVPNITFAQNFNPSFKVSSIGELSGKVIILDFFNSGCLACLKGIPVMDSLQKKFKGQIQVIMMTENSADKVEKFFTRLPKLPSFPIIINDSNFYSKMFPHDGDPLHIWIDRNGIVKAITDHHNTTESNIRKLISLDSINVFKRPVPVAFDVNKTLLQSDKEILVNQMEAYSIFFNSLNESFNFNRLRIFRDSVTGNENALTAINFPLYQLYSLAYSKELFSFPVNTRNLVNNNRILINLKNPLDLRKNTIDSVYDEWRKRNLVSYEFRVTDSDSFYSQLQSDLERFTPYTANLKFETKECLVLVASNKAILNIIKSKSKEGISYSDSSGWHFSGLNLQNSLLPQLAIVYQDQLFPIIDETNISRPVELKITGNLADLNNLNQQLSKYGLLLKKEFRKIKILQIEDKSK